MRGDYMDIFGSQRGIWVRYDGQELLADSPLIPHILVFEVQWTPMLTCIFSSPKLWFLSIISPSSMRFESKYLPKFFVFGLYFTWKWSETHFLRDLPQNGLVSPAWSTATIRTSVSKFIQLLSKNVFGARYRSIFTVLLPIFPCERSLMS